MVWKCQEGKHEETVRVVYGLITEVISDLPPHLLDYLFGKILEMPPSQYSEMYLLFLKDFTMKALESMNRAELLQISKEREAKQAEMGQEDEEIDQIPTD